MNVASRWILPLAILAMTGQGLGCASDLTEAPVLLSTDAKTQDAPAMHSLLAGPLSQGCGKPGLTSGTYTMQHRGLTRTYRVHVPAGYDMNQPTSLVMIFHGWGGDENEFLSDPTVLAEANARGYILVAPRGLGSGPPDFKLNSWSFRGSTTGLDGDGVNPDVPRDTEAICDPRATPNYTYPSCTGVAENSCSWTQCQDDDVDFVVALVDSMKANLCVDEHNVFATGGSNGGMFTWELGQNPASAPIFRAIAPLIGLPHRAYQDAPGKAADLPVLVITGINDKTVPPGIWKNPYYTRTSDGDRYYYSSATGIVRAWAEAHSCNISGKPTVFDDGYEATMCRTYCSDDPGWPRVLDCRANMGHVYNLNWSWPLIMDFFDHHAVK